MATYTNAYDKLYNNMKNSFTVVNDGFECTLGEYMLKKASVKSSDTNLPTTYNNTNAIAAIVSYVNDKLMVKEPPVKDKTIKAFPFRASAAALLSAVVTCGLVLSYGVAASTEQDPISYIAEADTENGEAEESVYTLSESQQ